MNPWPFVVVSYVIFFLGLAADALLPKLRHRRLQERLDSRWRRDQTRTAQRGST